MCCKIFVLRLHWWNSIEIGLVASVEVAIDQTLGHLSNTAMRITESIICYAVWKKAVKSSFSELCFAAIINAGCCLCHQVCSEAVLVGLPIEDTSTNRQSNKAVLLSFVDFLLHVYTATWTCNVSVADNCLESVFVASYYFFLSVSITIFIVLESFSGIYVEMLLLIGMEDL
jgi:hypothetical protein